MALKTQDPKTNSAGPPSYIPNIISQLMELITVVILTYNPPYNWGAPLCRSTSTPQNERLPALLLMLLLTVETAQQRPPKAAYAATKIKVTWNNYSSQRKAILSQFPIYITCLRGRFKFLTKIFAGRRAKS